jgi:hypothetical protein
MTIRKYALIVENDVFGTLMIDDDSSINPNGPRLTAGFSSDPKIVEVDPDLPVTHGWIWDGTTVNPPTE